MIRKTFIFCVVALCIIAIYGIASQYNAIKNVCRTATQINVSEIKARAFRDGLKVSDKIEYADKSVMLIFGHATYGRVVCFVSYKEELVLSAEFDVRD